MEKICVYTCITGNYDQVVEFPDLKEDNIAYYLFTNNKSIKSSFWNVVYINDAELDNIRLARKIKILGHSVLNKYDITVWIDGATYPKKKISEFINECCDMGEYSLVGFRHQERDCIYDEAKACVVFGKEDKEIVKKEVEFLKKENYPHHFGLIESAVLVRRNNDKKLKDTMKLWFDMVKNYSCRDQLSFNYAVYKTSLLYNLLDMAVFNNIYFGRNMHMPSKKLEKYFIYFGQYDNWDEFDYSLAYADKYVVNNGIYTIKKKAPCDGNVLNVIVDYIGGIKIKNVLVNGEYNSDIIYDNAVNINDDMYYFCKVPIYLKIKCNYKKNEIIIIELDIDCLSDIEYLDFIDSLYYEINDIKNKENSNGIMKRIVNKIKKIVRVGDNNVR